MGQKLTTLPCVTCRSNGTTVVNVSFPLCPFTPTQQNKVEITISPYNYGDSVYMHSQSMKNFITKKFNNVVMCNIMCLKCKIYS